MTLTINVDSASRWVIAEEKLWLTADRSRLVPGGGGGAAGGLKVKDERKRRKSKKS